MKYIFRFTIHALQLISLCCWCFFIGTAYGALFFIAGIFCGLQNEDWSYFLVGAALLAGHVISLPFSFLYSVIYGRDAWFTDETIFGI